MCRYAEIPSDGRKLNLLVEEALFGVYGRTRVRVELGLLGQLASGVSVASLYTVIPDIDVKPGA